jgi:glycerophosphoryl diester phosphodiesterase
VLSLSRHPFDVVAIHLPLVELHRLTHKEHVAVVANYSLWDAVTVAQVHGAGMRCLSYTVNDDLAAQHLLALGSDGIITDRIDLFEPDLN